MLSYAAPHSHTSPTESGIDAVCFSALGVPSLDWLLICGSAQHSSTQTNAHACPHSQRLYQLTLYLPVVRAATTRTAFTTST